MQFPFVNPSGSTETDGETTNVDARMAFWVLPYLAVLYIPPFLPPFPGILSP